MARIAVIGWGSLVWDPCELKLADGRWHKDGPKLPVEFARVSQGDRLTLVITPGAGLQTTLWAYSACETLAEAKADLVEREKTREQYVGALRDGWEGANVTEQGIARWLKGEGLDGVVWTALPPQAQNGAKRALTTEEAVDYVRSLEGDTFKLAKEYVENAPPQIDTPIRRALTEMFASR